MHHMKGSIMETLKFIDDETGDEIEFAILSACQHKEDGYILVADVNDLDDEELTVMVMVAQYIEGDEIVYEIVEDDDLLAVVYPKLEEKMEDF